MHILREHILCSTVIPSQNLLVLTDTFSPLLLHDLLHLLYKPSLSQLGIELPNFWSAAGAGVPLSTEKNEQYALRS